MRVVDETEDPTDIGVLKDFWVNEDRTREGDTLRQIRDVKLEETMESALNDYLLTALPTGTFTSGMKPTIRRS